MPSSKHGVHTLSSKTQGTGERRAEEHTIQRAGRIVVLWPWQRWCKHDLPAAVTCSGPAQDWPWRQSVTKTHVALSLPDERLATEIWGGGAAILFSCILWTNPLCSNGYFQIQAHTHGRCLNRTHTHTKQIIEQKHEYGTGTPAILSPFGLYYLFLVFCLGFIVVCYVHCLLCCKPPWMVTPHALLTLPCGPALCVSYTDITCAYHHIYHVGPSQLPCVCIDL